MPATATFEITPARPGTPERQTCTEDDERLAVNVGLVRAVQAAGWAAFVYGQATVLHVESGRTWSITCSPNQAGR